MTGDLKSLARDLKSLAGLREAFIKKYLGLGLGWPRPVGIAWSGGGAAICKPWPTMAWFGGGRYGLVG